MFQPSKANGSAIERRNGAASHVDELSPELREVLHMLDEFENHPNHTVRK